MLRKKFYNTKLYSYWPTRDETRDSSWLSDCLISLSPIGDFMLLSDGISSAWVIKFKSPLSLNYNHTEEQFFIKPLQLILDPVDNEHSHHKNVRITSILCQPIMSSQRTGVGSVDWTLMCFGHSNGHIRFYTEQSQCLIDLDFSDDPVLAIKCSTQKHHPQAQSECDYATINDEFIVIYKTFCVIIDGFTLYENLKLARIEFLKSHSYVSFTATTLPHLLTCKRFQFCEVNVTNCENLGIRKRSTFDMLVSCSSNNSPDPTKLCGQTIVTIGRNPFLAYHREEIQQTTPSYTEWIGSIVSLFGAPKHSPPKIQVHEICQQPPQLQFFDRERSGDSLIVSPDRRLFVITDNFGRITLFDNATSLAVRQWKGYRAAQCGWIETPRDRESRTSPRAQFLVIYAPKRGLLEIWSCQKGPRIAAFNVGKDCRLLYECSKMLNQQAELALNSVSSDKTSTIPCVEQCYSHNCLLLSPTDYSIYVIDTPFTCSLAKDGDVKSRDNLLLIELEHLIRQFQADVFVAESIPEFSSCTDFNDIDFSQLDVGDPKDHTSAANDVINDRFLSVLNRITLAESRHQALKKILYQSTLPPRAIKGLVAMFQSEILQNYHRQFSCSQEFDGPSLTNKEQTKVEEELTNDDKSLIGLCNRIIRLCNVYLYLSKHQILIGAQFPKLQARTIDIHTDHPEIEKLAQALGWTQSEVMRTLSLQAFESSFKFKQGNSSDQDKQSSYIFQEDPWPNLGEPIDWSEFLTCFDLEYQYRSENFALPKLRLAHLTRDFVSTERVCKIASLVFMSLFFDDHHYSTDQVSEHKPTHEHSQKEKRKKLLRDAIESIDVPSRVLLLFQFWLSSRLCNYWTTWPRLQGLTTELSDLLMQRQSCSDKKTHCLTEIAGSSKSIAKKSKELDTEIDKEKQSIEELDDSLAIETWKQVYRLILESDNLLAALVATISIKSDIKRLMSNCKNQENEIGENEDWENLCIDAERLGLLSKQLEDVLFLQLLLSYSPNERHRVNHYVYTRMQKISVANVLRSGETCVSELVAQWALQSNIDLELFSSVKTPISPDVDENNRARISVHEISGFTHDEDSRSTLSHNATPATDGENLKRSEDDAKCEVGELLHQVRSSFPASLEPDVILANCFWEFCAKWSNSPANNLPSEIILLRKSLNCLSLLSSTKLRHRFALLAWRTYFQHRLERLVILLENSNQDLLNYSSVNMNERERDQLCKQQLNMGQDCLEGFVQYCCVLAELLLQTHMQSTVEQMPLFVNDDWWSTSENYVQKSVHFHDDGTILLTNEANNQEHQRNALFYGASSLREIDINILIELNRLCSIVYLIIKLHITHSYPLTLMGDEGQQILRIKLGRISASSKSFQHLDVARLQFLIKCLQRLSFAYLYFKRSQHSCNLPSSEDVSQFQDRSFNFDQTSFTSNSFDIDDSDQISTISTVAAGTDISKRNLSSKKFDFQSVHQESVVGLVKEIQKDENFIMTLFDLIVSLTREWKLDLDTVHREFVCELYRNNCDQLGAQIATRVGDQSKMSINLLRIASQRILALTGLSAYTNRQWRQNVDQFSLFNPSLSIWLKQIQHEERQRKLPPVKFVHSYLVNSIIGNKLTGQTNENQTETNEESESRVQELDSLKALLEYTTNHLSGQQSRTAYDLIDALELLRSL